MKVKPQDPYLLLKKYVKPVVPGKIILSQEESYPNWGIIQDQCVNHDGSPFKFGEIVQIKPYSKILVEGLEDLFLVKREDIIAVIEE